MEPVTNFHHSHWYFRFRMWLLEHNYSIRLSGAYFLSCSILIYIYIYIYIYSNVSLCLWYHWSMQEIRRVLFSIFTNSILISRVFETYIYETSFHNIFCSRWRFCVCVPSSSTIQIFEFIRVSCLICIRIRVDVKYTISKRVLNCVLFHRSSHDKWFFVHWWNIYH